MDFKIKEYKQIIADIDNEINWNQYIGKIALNSTYTIK